MRVPPAVRPGCAHGCPCAGRQNADSFPRVGGCSAQKGRQSMAATRHRSTARRFVRSACRIMASIVGTDRRTCHRRVVF
ncbi:hypothetical protein STRIP9103_04380 [Streptomyces ipomoeae 91-03]|uniref:Uncharacterized protein n=1 Tax=Streptomyces ipomoeae 91-03 TaxID=698759 RepID=L1KW58_9ACTN|nr:hypothetical protein STRIP9103_04380 [Streptomyces ipomoeae 91-03]